MADMVHKGEIVFWSSPDAMAADLDGNPYPLGDVGSLIKPGSSVTYHIHPSSIVDRNPVPPLSAMVTLQPVVNDEMRQAARGAAITSGYLPYDDGTNEAIYRAMRPLEQPSQSITVVTEDVLGQRNAAWERIRYLEAVVANMPNAESVKEMLDAKDAIIATCHRALSMKDARIAELKSILACTPVAFEDPDAKPAPVPGFLRAIRTGNKQVVGMVTGRGDMPGSTDG